MKITDITTRNIRFPTSQHLGGLDAMNPDPDYSAAYVIVQTDSSLTGHGLAFTIGRGNEIVVAAVSALKPLIVAHRLEEFTADHLLEHFVTPCEIRNGHYVAPRAAGYSTQMKSLSLAQYEFPNGSIWIKV
jgi:L-alanine-DL-glutamate epimerase-like enolase superfamily enzyme